MTTEFIDLLLTCLLHVDAVQLAVQRQVDSSITIDSYVSGLLRIVHVSVLQCQIHSGRSKTVQSLQTNKSL